MGRAKEWCLFVVAFAAAPIVFAQPVTGAAKSVSKASPKPGVKKAAPKAKADPARDFMVSLLGNSTKFQTSLYRDCINPPFAAMAIGLSKFKDVLKPDKGEFESSDEFLKRVEGGADIITRNGPYFICQSLNKNEDAPFTYDADSEVFSGNIPAQQTVDRSYKRLPDYVGRTRMGIRFTVHPSVEIDYNVSLSFPTSRTNCLSARGLSASDRDYSVSVPRSQAPAVKSSAYLVLIGYISDPYVDMADDNPVASLDDPYDRSTRVYTVYFTPHSIAVVMPGDKKLWECDLMKDER